MSPAVEGYGKTKNSKAIRKAQILPKLDIFDEAQGFLCRQP